MASARQRGILDTRADADTDRYSAVGSGSAAEWQSRAWQTQWRQRSAPTRPAQSPFYPTLNTQLSRPLTLAAPPCALTLLFSTPAPSRPSIPTSASLNTSQILISVRRSRHLRASRLLVGSIPGTYLRWWLMSPPHLWGFPLLGLYSNF